MVQGQICVLVLQEEVSPVAPPPDLPVISPFEFSVGNGVGCECRGRGSKAADV